MNKRSDLLKLVLERYGGENRTPASVNALFTEILKLLIPDTKIPELTPDITVSVFEELKQLHRFFEKNHIDADKTLMLMEDSVTEEKDRFMDSFKFSKLMRELDFQPLSGEKDCVDCISVCERILQSPTAVIELVTQGANGGGQSMQIKDDTDEDEADSEEDIDKLLAELFGEDTEEIKRMMDSGEKPTMAQLMDRVEKVRTVLTENVFGQDHAISAFVSGFFQSELTATVFEDRDKPRATFLFAGPPGVGKTFLSELVAKALGLPFKRFDMSEYNNKESGLEFAGSDKVYKNGAKGNVTSFVEENPRCVLLFDEIEKAHISVIYLFLQILDAGRLRDNFTDEEVSFKDAIIILTTNAGKRLYEDESINIVNTPKKTILRALGAEVNPETNTPLFPTAICSRFASGNVVMFNRMQGDFLLRICENEMNKQCEAITNNMGVKVSFENTIPYAVLFGEGGKADARTIKAKSIKFIYDETYELLRLMKSSSNPYDISQLKSIKFTLSPSKDSAVSSLFKIKGKPTVLIFADKAKSLAFGDKFKGVNVLTADSVEEAKELIDAQDVTFTLCDLCYNTRDDRVILNREDIHSTGMDYFEYITTRTNIPVYILQSAANKFSEEEMQSLTAKGASGVFEEDWSTTHTAKFIKQISLASHLKKSMSTLARANKVLSFGTAQTIEGEGTEAVISLYDLKLITAVDAEDNEGMLNDVSRPSVRFSDVIGAKDAKGELKYFIDYLKDPVKYVRRGIKAPKGILLYGPPGTGKTLLAKAMAGESNVTFIRAEGNQFLKKYVGQGVESVHKLFTTARKYAPSILFIDEIDAIAKDRQNAAESSTASDVLTAFLTEMDGFVTDKDRPVFVLAATNFSIEGGGPRSLDPALLRRFDRRIYIDLPDREERTQ
ncbi:MAG: AAA family ATPase, partial [Candidatus Coproplasma sp.]